MQLVPGTDAHPEAHVQSERQGDRAPAPSRAPSTCISSLQTWHRTTNKF